MSLILLYNGVPRFNLCFWKLLQMKSFRGYDCRYITAHSSDFTEWRDESQSGKHAWAFQARYTYYTLYIATGLIMLLLVKRLIFMYTDYSYRNTILGHRYRRVMIWSRICSWTRYIAYKRTSILISRITGLPPSFGTIIVIFFSTVYVLLIVFVPHFWYRGCEEFGSPPLAVRAAVMTSGMTPFLFILGGKVNIVSAITGISYEKLNFYHQLLGWGLLFCALVHVFPYLIQAGLEGGVSQVRNDFKRYYIYKTGVAPTVLLFLICITSTRFFRNRLYELWLHSHWIISLVYLATFTWHGYNDLYTQKYTWATITVCGFQLLYRALVKTSFFKPNGYSLKPKVAKLRSLPNGVYQVLISVESKEEFHWSPGEHIFLRFIYGVHTLDNHPFTIMTAPQTTKCQLKLVVKPQNGLTKKLYDAVNDEKTFGRKYKVFIDGPYGGMSRDFHSFDKLFLLASGTGIAVTFPFLQHTVQNLEDVTSKVKNIDFVWVTNSLDSLVWIKEELIGVLNSAVQKDMLQNLDLHIFVTNSVNAAQCKIVESHLNSTEINTTSEVEEKSIYDHITIDESNLSRFVHIHYEEKPKLTSYIPTFTLFNKNAFILSGNSTFQIDAGNAISNLQSRVGPDIEEIYLHSESFGW